jgi:hypothetical protein
MAYATPASNPAMYANWGQRVGAYLIDYLPIFVLELIAVISRNGIVWVLFIIASLAWWIYNRCIQAGRTGQSLGKRTLHRPRSCHRQASRAGQRTASPLRWRGSAPT